MTKQTIQRRSRNALLFGAMLCALMAVSLVTMAQSTLPDDAPALPVTLNPLNATHRDTVESIHGTPFTIQFDPDGVMAFYMGGSETAKVPEGTYAGIRYVLFKYDALELPTLQLQARGGFGGSGNPSHAVIFGWEDYKNYYYVYAAESPETRVARVVDGRHETLYRHGSIIWVRDRDVYQDLKVEVVRDGDATAVNTYVNGELAMTYTFASHEVPPAGRVGFGSWNDSNHSAYFKNIKLDDK